MFVITLLLFLVAAVLFLTKSETKENYLGWKYGYSPYGYGGFGRRYYAGYSTDDGRWFGRYGNYGGYNGYPYYRGYTGWWGNGVAGYPRGWGGYGWF